jgi:hypothetical protein
MYFQVFQYDIQGYLAQSLSNYILVTAGHNHQSKIFIYIGNVSSNTQQFSTKSTKTSHHQEAPVHEPFIKTKCRLLYLKAWFIPRSKHFLSVIKTNQFM